MILTKWPKLTKLLLTLLGRNMKSNLENERPKMPSPEEEAKRWERVLEMINGKRVEEGLPPVSSREELEKIYKKGNY